MNIAILAKNFACKAHQNQRRKYTDEPYINHCENVVRILSPFEVYEPMLAAAWLHDVVEDTDVELHQIQQLFGSEVAMMVTSLTKPALGKATSRTMKLELYNRQLALGSYYSQTIKIADILDNIATIKERDPGFAQGYLQEKRVQLEYLRDGHHLLLLRATKLLNKLGV